MPLHRNLKVLILSLTASLTLGCAAPTLSPQSHPASISVLGSGEVRAVPDLFRVRAVASREGQDINAMKQAVDREVTTVLALARNLNIEEKDLQALSLSVQPQWEWQPERRLVGYRVSRELDIRVSGLERYAELLEGMTRIGLHEINPVGAEISNLNQIEQQALAKAVQDARARAAVMAEAAGRSLGRVLSIQSEGAQAVVPMPAAMEMKALRADSSGWSAGETRVVQRVQVQFALD